LNGVGKTNLRITLGNQWIGTSPFPQNPVLESTARKYVMKTTLYGSNQGGGDEREGRGKFFLEAFLVQLKHSMLMSVSGGP